MNSTRWFYGKSEDLYSQYWDSLWYFYLGNNNEVGFAFKSKGHILKDYFKDPFNPTTEEVLLFELELGVELEEDFYEKITNLTKGYMYFIEEKQ